MNILFLTVSSCQLLIGISIITHTLIQTCCSAKDSLVDTLTFQKTCGARKLCVMREVLLQKSFYFMILHLPSGSMMYVGISYRQKTLKAILLFALCNETNNRTDVLYTNAFSSFYFHSNINIYSSKHHNVYNYYILDYLF